MKKILISKGWSKKLKSLPLPFKYITNICREEEGEEEEENYITENGESKPKNLKLFYFLFC